MGRILIKCRMGNSNLFTEEWFKLKPSQTLKKGFGAFHPEELASVPQAASGGFVTSDVKAVVLFDVDEKA